MSHVTAGTERPRRHPDTARRRRSGTPRAGGSPCAGALCLSRSPSAGRVAALVPCVRLKDAVALHEFTMLGHRAGGRRALKCLLHLLDPSLFIGAGDRASSLALAPRGHASRSPSPVVLALAPLSAEAAQAAAGAQPTHSPAPRVDRRLLAERPCDGRTALALCAVLVAPRRLRPVVAVLGGALHAGRRAVSLLDARAWHMPSDVIGGILLAALWVAVAVAALRASERACPPQRSARLGSRRRRRARRGPRAAPRPSRWRRGEDEQQVREPVEVAHDLRVGVLRRRSRDAPRAGRPCGIHAGAPPREFRRDDERAQWRERRVDLVAGLLEPLRVLRP